MIPPPLAPFRNCPFSNGPHRLTLVLAGFLLASMAPASRTQDPKVLNNPILRHTPSVGRAFTSSHDGKWLFHSEGGTMVFIKANATNGNIDEDDYRIESKLKRVGTGPREVLVAKMILDPAADPEPGPLANNPANLLYMACGRDGLWIMEADVDPTAVNQAWPVDDSGNDSDLNQNSRRWCADVGLCQVQGVDYLAAIFTKKGHSVLRVYSLAQVRAAGTGGVMNPLDQIILSSNSAAPSISSTASYSRPVSLALAVDQESNEESGQYADLYVAMGPHGVVRVSLKGDAAGGLLSLAKTDGPVFGSFTAYDQNSPPGTVPDSADASAGLYGDWVQMSDWKFLSTQVEQRHEAPMFVDVAVHDSADAGDGLGVHQLFVAVDHLFWVVFDLHGPFSPQMPILHHEGDRWSFSGTYGSWSQPMVKPLDPADGGIDEVSFARSLAIVDGGVQGPLLVVTGSRRSILRDFMDTSLEAIGFDEHLQPGRTWTEVASSARTYVYRIQASYPDADFNIAGSFDEGGGGVYVPPTQDLTAEPYLAVFHSSFIVNSAGESPPAMSLTRMLLPWAVGGPVQTFRRPNQSHRGRMAFNIGHSILDPNLLLTSGNDAGLPQDGFVVMGKNPAPPGSYEVKVYDDSSASDRRGSGNILADAEMQWIDPLDPEAEYWWTSGVYPDPGGDPKKSVAGFKLIHIVLKGGDAFSFQALNQPNQDWHGYIQPPLNRYGKPGRVYYQAGCMNRDFDAFLGPGESRLFGTWQKSPEGLVVLDGEKVVDLLKLAPGTIIDSSTWQSNEMRLLVTHPEFNNMPVTDTDLQKWWGGTLNKDLNGLVGAWPSKLIQLPGGSWVLAVPCGQIHADPAWEIYDGAGQAWLPPSGSIWEAEFTKGLVQFWEMKPDPTDGNRYWPEVADPTVVGVAGLSPLQKIIAPDTETVIGTLESVTMTHNGVPETYLFCADFGGHLYVYSIIDIASSSGIDTALDNNDPTKLVATWNSKANFFDDQPSLIWDIAIDYRGGTSEKAMIYVTSPRVGVQVLEFEVKSGSTTQPTLTFKKLIQSSGWTTGVDVRENADGSRHLLVSENGGGFRVFEEAP